MEVSPVLSQKLEKSALILGKIANLWVKFLIYRSSHWRCSVRKGVLKTFAKFTGKHLCQNLFLNRVTGLRPATLLKRDSGAGAFLRFCEISMNIFFTEHLRATASAFKMQFFPFFLVL